MMRRCAVWLHVGALQAAQRLHYHNHGGGHAEPSALSLPSTLEDSDAMALLYGRQPSITAIANGAAGSHQTQGQLDGQGRSGLPTSLHDSQSFVALQVRIADAAYTQGWSTSNVHGMAEALLRCVLANVWTPTPCTAASLRTASLGGEPDTSCYPVAILQAATSLLAGLRSCCMDTDSAPSKHTLQSLTILLCISTCFLDHDLDGALHEALCALLRQVLGNDAGAVVDDIGADVQSALFAMAALEVATAGAPAAVARCHCVQSALRRCLSRRHRPNSGHTDAVAQSVDWIATAVASVDIVGDTPSTKDNNLALLYASIFAKARPPRGNAPSPTEGGGGALACMRFIAQHRHSQTLTPNSAALRTTSTTIPPDDPRQWLRQSKDALQCLAADPASDVVATMPRMMLFGAVVQALVHVYPLAATSMALRDTTDWLVHTCPHAVAMFCGSASLTAFCRVLASTSDTVHPNRLWPLLCVNGGRECLAAVDDVVANLPASDGARVAILDAVQRLFGHRVIATSPALLTASSLVASPSVASQAATWQSAVQQVSALLTATAAPNDSDGPRSDWRHHIPAAMAVTSAAGKYDVTIALFDEYAALTHGTDVHRQTDAPLTASISIDAVCAFAKAIERTGRWYRAIDVLDAVGHCAVSPNKSAVGVWASTASALRSRWEEALRLLAMVAPRADDSDDASATLDGTSSSAGVGRQDDPVARAVLPFAVEAVSQMTTTGGHWRNAVAYLDRTWGAFDLATASTATHVEAVVSMHAWLAPRSAYATLCSVIDGRNNGNDAGQATLLRPPRAKCRTLMNVVAHQFAQRGHWAAALSLVQSPHGHLVVHGWDRVAAALQHASRTTDHVGDYHLTQQQPIDWATALRVMQLVPKEVLATRHSVLRLLLRAAENGDWMPTYAAHLRSVLAERGPDGEEAHTNVLAEYAAWAALVASESNVAPADRVTSPGLVVRSPPVPMRLTDSYLVHAACRAPWLCGRRSVAADDNGRPMVRFVWTQSHVDALRQRFRGDVHRFVLEVLQLPGSQVHSRDLAKSVARGGPRVGEAWRLFGLVGCDAAAVHAVRSLILLRTSTGVVVGSKPFGADTDVFAAHVGQCLSAPLVPLYRLQQAAHGLMVLVPVSMPRWQFHLTFYVLLGLRRVDDHALPLASTRFFRRFHMRPFHVVDVGVVCPGSDVVMVEAMCTSDAAHGPPGTLYALSMDMQLEGWGYAGDPGNAYLEQAADAAARGSRRPTDSEDAVLSGRALLFVREIIVRCPLEPASVVHVEMPPPRWWVDAGLVPSDI